MAWFRRGKRLLRGTWLLIQISPYRLISSRKIKFAKGLLSLPELLPERNMGRDRVEISPPFFLSATQNLFIYPRRDNP